MPAGAGRRSGTSGTGTTSSWPPACTSGTSKRRTAKPRSGASPSSTSRREEHHHDDSTLAPATAQVQQDNTGFGTSSGEFLLLGAGARGAALGGAFAALTTDVTALYYNPAGLAEMSRPGAMVSTYSYIAGTRYSWAGIGFPMSGGARAIGVSVGTFGFSDQPVYTLDNPDGNGE